MDTFESTSALISIHSLRVEGDILWNVYKLLEYHFNPLPPCGGRLTIYELLERGRLFQSTPSVWRETFFDKIKSGLYIFQSTPSVWRETRDDSASGRNAGHFNPLPPCGGRQQNYTAFRLKLSRANAILTKKNTDTLLHVRKNTFFLIFLRKSGCESLLLFLCA